MKPGTPEFEARLQHLRAGLQDNQHDVEEDNGDESPGADLAVQSRVDSVQLAKGRLSSSSGQPQGSQSKTPGDRSQLPPAGGKSRLGQADKQNSGIAGITRKLRSSIGMSRKEKQETGEEPGPLQHVQFDDHVEHVEPGSASGEASP